MSLKKLYVKNYDPAGYICLLEEAGTKKKYLIRIRFYYVYREIKPGTVLYMPDSILSESVQINIRLTYGPIGVSPLANKTVYEDDLIIVDFFDGTAMILQRYIFAISDANRTQQTVISADLND